ncbi:amidase [Nocardia brasiliensis]|uniref:amidase n=1 Tax=Nocardia brasiliensis TaxID=37326 RepID=UPI003799B52F
MSGRDRPVQATDAEISSAPAVPMAGGVSWVLFSDGGIVARQRLPCVRCHRYEGVSPGPCVQWKCSWKMSEGSINRIRSRNHGGGRRSVSVLEAIQETLSRVHRSNRVLNAFSHVADVSALSAADKMDRQVPAHDAKSAPLAGVPFAVGDLDECRGMPTRYGSNLHQHARPSALEGPMVHRLRAAGAIPIGKTAVSEFGWGPVARTATGAVARNPWRWTRSPGGGGGGAAAAVAAGLVPFAIGSHWCGGIRISAAHCGVVGFKPSQGLIPLSGLCTPGSYGGDLHCAGLLTTSVADAALLLELVAGPYPYDRASSVHHPQPYVDQVSQPTPPRVRLGWLSDPIRSQEDSETSTLSRAAATQVAAVFGARMMMVELALGDTDALMTPATVGLATMLEAAGSAYHSLEECGPDVRAVVATVIDAKAGVSGLLARLAHAEQCRMRLQIRTTEVFERVDVLLTVAAPDAAPAVVDDGADGLGQGLGVESRDVLANACWLPAVSVPVGFSSAGLPVGLQVIGRYGQDSTVLAVARVVEQVCAHRPMRHEMTIEQGIR